MGLECGGGGEAPALQEGPKFPPYRHWRAAGWQVEGKRWRWWISGLPLGKSAWYTLLHKQTFNKINWAYMKAGELFTWSWASAHQVAHFCPTENPQLHFLTGSLDFSAPRLEANARFTFNTRDKKKPSPGIFYGGLNPDHGEDFSPCSVGGEVQMMGWWTQ